MSWKQKFSPQYDIPLQLYAATWIIRVHSYTWVPRGIDLWQLKMHGSRGAASQCLLQTWGQLSISSRATNPDYLHSQRQKHMESNCPHLEVEASRDALRGSISSS